MNPYLQVTLAAAERMFAQELHTPQFEVLVNPQLEQCVLTSKTDVEPRRTAARLEAERLRRHANTTYKTPCERAEFLFFVAQSIELEMRGLHYDEALGAWAPNETAPLQND